jgi:hypothetical protein
VERRARDLELLDLLDTHKGVSFEGDVWRIVREEREPLLGYPAGDPASFGVLYTSQEREGSLEEIHFHSSRQPVFPSKIRSVIHRISVRTQRTLRIANLAELRALGVTPETYGSLSYERTQEIGDAAAFLGFDGIWRPARAGLARTSFSLPSTSRRPISASSTRNRSIGTTGENEGIQSDGNESARLDPIRQGRGLFAPTARWPW